MNVVRDCSGSNVLTDDSSATGLSCIGSPRYRSSCKFFPLLFALSVPFWLIGAVTDLQLMPGLSVSALMAFAAAIVIVAWGPKTLARCNGA